MWGRTRPKRRGLRTRPQTGPRPAAWKLPRRFQLPGLGLSGERASPAAARARAVGSDPDRPFSQFPNPGYFSPDRIFIGLFTVVFLVVLV